MEWREPSQATQSRCSCEIARCRGVFPFLSGILTFAPREKRSFDMERFPCSIAW